MVSEAILTRRAFLLSAAMASAAPAREYRRGGMVYRKLGKTGLDVSLGAGESTIDLSGNWTRDLDVTVDAGAGSIQMRLPSNVGVRVEVDTGLGSVDAFNLKKDGNVYTNDAYATSDVTLDVMLKAGLGEIDLEVVEEAAILLDSPWGIGRGVFQKK